MVLFLYQGFTMTEQFYGITTERLLVLEQQRLQGTPCLDVSSMLH